MRRIWITLHQQNTGRSRSEENKKTLTCATQYRRRILCRRRAHPSSLAHGRKDRGIRMDLKVYCEVAPDDVDAFKGAESAPFLELLHCFRPETRQLSFEFVASKHSGSVSIHKFFAPLFFAPCEFTLDGFHAPRAQPRAAAEFLQPVVHRTCQNVQQAR